MKVSVIGRGIVGLSAAYEIQKAGHEVVIIDDGNPQASAGESRIFRILHEDPFYTKKARRALLLWREWERDWGETLLVPCGLWARWGEGGDILGKYPLGSRRDRYQIDFCGARGNIKQTMSLLQEKTRAEEVRGRVRSVSGKSVLLEGGEKIRGDFTVVAAGKNTAPLLGKEEEFSHHVRFLYPLGEPSLMLDTLPALIDKKLGIYGIEENDNFAIGISRNEDLGFSRTQNLSEEEARLRENFIRKRRRETGRIVSSHFPFLQSTPEEEVYYIHPRGRDGYRLWEEENLLGIGGNNLFKFAPLLGQIAARSAEQA